MGNGEGTENDPEFPHNYFKGHAERDTLNLPQSHNRFM